MPARRLVPFGLAALLVLSAHSPARAGGEWGSIKGRVVLDGPTPTPAEITVDADGPACLAKGKLYSQEYVVDEKTRGVRWVVVWLMPDDYNKDNLKAQFKKINPDAEPKDKEVFLDQPCCQFEPRVLCIRAGKQRLTVKNSATIQHSIMIAGGMKNPDLNTIIAPGKSLEIKEDWNPTGVGAVEFKCAIHKWMKGYIRAFNHPYYAVTNENGEFEIKGAPKGKCRLIVFHEAALYVVGEKEPDRYGIPITVVADKTTDLGDFKLKPSSP
jgi:hypothetical protein